MVAVHEEEATPAVPLTSTTAGGHFGVPHDYEVPVKRRKVRKGTRSCWECKRRKISCVFASLGDGFCVGCQRRRTPCVPQEMPEDSAAGRRRGECREVHLKASSVSLFRAPLTPEENLGAFTPNASLLTPDPQNLPVPGDATETKTTLHHLFSAFPSEHDSDILLRESPRPWVFTDLVNTQSHSKLTYEALAEPHPVRQLPGQNSHPVTVAYCMLMFAITLLSRGERIRGLSEPHSVLMHRLVKAATTWVTTREEMHGTVEGLICIILEGVFELNSGNLRRAWGVFRRAMTVAQLMGLHRSPIPALKRIDPNTEADPAFLWFRIVHMDRYFSLLLGLPQGTSDKSIGSASAICHEPPLGKFERQLTVLASRILERNESGFVAGETLVTHCIDSELLGVAKSMPASFWRPANFHNQTLGSPDVLLETIRLSAQVYYYSLLIQLHLPYMMRIGDNAAHEYSKLTCVNAAREIITRFIAHRTFSPMSSCSRPVDFFALLAAMTLILAHLDAHYNREATNFLAHQRLSDRALLDQALERMDIISAVNRDLITGNSARLIRRLLDIEADAAEGTSYTTRSTTGEEDAQDSKDNADDLRLRIPYLGIIKISRQGPISGPIFPGELGASQRPSETPGLHAPGYQHDILQDHDSIALQTNSYLSLIESDVENWTFQGVDTAFFDSLMRGSNCMDAAD